MIPMAMLAANPVPAPCAVVSMAPASVAACVLVARNTASGLGTMKSCQCNSHLSALQSARINANAITGGQTRPIHLLIRSLLAEAPDRAFAFARRTPARRGSSRDGRVGDRLGDRK